MDNSIIYAHILELFLNLKNLNVLVQNFINALNFKLPRHSWKINVYQIILEDYLLSKIEIDGSQIMEDLL